MSKNWNCSAPPKPSFQPRPVEPAKIILMQSAKCKVHIAELRAVGRLSLIPLTSLLQSAFCTLQSAFKVVGLTGFEPVTLRLSSACSNQLSYRPNLVELRRFELLTYSLQSYRSTN